MRGLMILIFAAASQAASAQYIADGPVFNKITSDSAVVYLRVPDHQFVTVELSTDSLFSSSIWFETNLLEVKLFTVEMTLDNLKPGTEYFYRLYADNKPDKKRGSFSTLPKP